MIVASFIELLLTRAAATPPTIDDAELSRMLLASLQALLEFVGGAGGTPLEAQPFGFAPRFLVSIELVLYAAATHQVPPHP